MLVFVAKSGVHAADNEDRGASRLSSQRQGSEPPAYAPAQRAKQFPSVTIPPHVGQKCIRCTLENVFIVCKEYVMLQAVEGIPGLFNDKNL